MFLLLPPRACSGCNIPRSRAKDDTHRHHRNHRSLAAPVRLRGHRPCLFCYGCGETRLISTRKVNAHVCRLYSPLFRIKQSPPALATRRTNQTGRKSDLVQATFSSNMVLVVRCSCAARGCVVLDSVARTVFSPQNQIRTTDLSKIHVWFSEQLETGKYYPGPARRRLLTPPPTCKAGALVSPE